MLTGYPSQTTDELATRFMVGTGLATRVILVTPEQVPSEVVTVYTVVTDGFTAMVGPTTPKGCHVKPGAGDTAVKVEGLPAQIIVGEAMALIGSGATVMLVTAL